MVAVAEKAVVGERIRALRGSRTQAEVAKAVGVTAMAISQYEQGERMPTDEIKARLANYFKKPIASIFYTQ